MSLQVHFSRAHESDAALGRSISKGIGAIVRSDDQALRLLKAEPEERLVRRRQPRFDDARGGRSLSFPVCIIKIV